MKQDLNLTFVDLLGYLLPGGTVVWFMLNNLTINFQAEWVFYLAVTGFGYLLGHLLLMFHFVSIRRLAGWVTGDPRVSLPRSIDPSKYSDSIGGKMRLFWARFMLWIRKNARRLIGLPPLSIDLEKKIWSQDNWSMAPSNLLSESLRERDLMHLYWWALNSNDTLYKRNRRLRAFELLFGNSTLALLIILLITYGGSEGALLWYLFLGLAILCFLSYPRYRFFSLRHIAIYGYFQLVWLNKPLASE